MSEIGPPVLDEAESLRRHLRWLYGPDGVYPGNLPCRCEHGIRSLGRVNGTNMGSGWVRITTHPGCSHHGTKAEGERKRRQRAAYSGSQQQAT